MVDLWLVVLLAAVALLLVAALGCVAILAMGKAMANQNALVDRLAIHLKARDILDVRAGFAPEPEKEEPKEDRPFDTVERGFADMRAAGLDPEEPEHMKVWNALRAGGGIIEPGQVPT